MIKNASTSNSELETTGGKKTESLSKETQAIEQNYKKVLKLKNTTTKIKSRWVGSEQNGERREHNQ